MRTIFRISTLFYITLCLVSCESSDDPVQSTPFDRDNPPCHITNIKIDFDCIGCTDIYEERYDYNSSNLITTIEYFWGTKDENGSLTDTYSYKVEYKYDSLRRPFSRIVHGNDRNVSDDTLYYEYNGNQIEVVSYMYSSRSINNTIILDENQNPKKYYQPSKGGSVKSFTWSNGNIIFESFDSTYFGNLDKAETTREFNSNINPLAYSSLYSIEPVSKNLVTSYHVIVHYKNPESVVSSNGQYVYTYNDNGFPDEVLHLREFGSETDTTKYTYEYECD